MDYYEKQIEKALSDQKNGLDTHAVMGYMCPSRFVDEFGFTQCSIWTSLGEHREYCPCALYGTVEVVVKINRYIPGIGRSYSDFRDSPEMWEMTQVAIQNIQNAIRLLPVELLDPDEEICFTRFKKILEESKQTRRAGDLEWSVNRLSMIGDNLLCEAPFWRELLAAAEILGLIYKRKIFQ